MFKLLGVALEKLIFVRSEYLYSLVNCGCARDRSVMMECVRPAIGKLRLRRLLAC